jgi:hypothetical protein
VTATVRSTGTPTNSGSVAVTSFSPAMPAGFVAGDLLIGIVCASNGTVPSTRPGGSTSVLNFVDGAIWSMDVVRKTAAGGDTFSWSVGTARGWAGCVIAITAGTWDTTTPITGAAGVALGTTATLSVPTPSATPANTDSLIIAAFGISSAGAWSNSNTAPTMTELCDTAATTPAVDCGVYRSNTPPAASAISRTGASTLSSANGGGFIMFVNPSAAALVRHNVIMRSRAAVQRASRW